MVQSPKIRKLMAMTWAEQIELLRTIPLAGDHREEWLMAHNLPVEWINLSQIQMLDQALILRPVSS